MNSDPSRKRKLSEMISEIAADFIGIGKTAEERQGRLNSVCSAWNMACGPPEDCQRQLEHYIEALRCLKPGNSPSNLANIRKDLVSLIERKLQMFPEDRRPIISAKVVILGTDFRIEVESAALH